MRKRSQASETGAALARIKWAKTTRAQRAAHARMMNQVRWAAVRRAALAVAVSEAAK